MIAKKLAHDFCQQAELTHPGQFDYAGVVDQYQNMHAPIELFCRPCGKMIQTTPRYLVNYGCADCNKRQKQVDFIDKATQKYGNKYSYELVKFTTMKCKGHIICN